jgi:hypothetical protein
MTTLHNFSHRLRAFFWCYAAHLAIMLWLGIHAVALLYALRLALPLLSVCTSSEPSP